MGDLRERLDELEATRFQFWVDDSLVNPFNPSVYRRVTPALARAAAVMALREAVRVLMRRVGVEMDVARERYSTDFLDTALAKDEAHVDGIEDAIDGVKEMIEELEDDG